MPLTQKIFALFVCLSVFLICLELVRRRKLREEYSVLWLTTSVIMFVLVLKYEWLVALTHFIGAKVVTSTLFLGSIIFLLLISVQFSIRLSRMADQIKNLVQENSSLRAEIDRIGVEMSTNGKLDGN